MRTTAAALFAWMLVTVGCYTMQRSLIYFPAASLPSPSEGGAPSMHEVRLRTADGLNLVAWYAEARDGKPTVIYFHGNAGSIADRVYKTYPFTYRGYGLLLVSYRGYGGNPGHPTEQGLFEDGRAAIAFMSAQGVSAERMIVLGESLGTGVAVRMASETRVGALILEAPFTSLADAGQRAFPFLPVRLLAKDRYDSLSVIGHVHSQLLVIHGEKDDIVPTEQGRKLLAAANEPKRGAFLPSAGHNDLFHHGAAKIELDFLDEVFGRQ